MTSSCTSRSRKEIYSAVMAMFIIFWHRANIQRMRDGVENRNEKLMLFRRKARPADNEQH